MNDYQFSGENTKMNFNHPQEETMSSNLRTCILSVGSISYTIAKDHLNKQNNPPAFSESLIADNCQ